MRRWAGGLLFVLIVSGSAAAQNRGVYPLGMSVINSGVTPGQGFSYANQLLFYSRDEAKDDQGRTVATGANSVIMDMNTITWVSRTRVFGARYAASATIPIARNNLTSDVTGPVSGGGGLADSYYLPVILGWTADRAAVKAMYGFLAPTGQFENGANDNVGSGYWTHTASTGQTFTLTDGRRVSLSAFEMYEWHTTQSGSGVRPGDTVEAEFSVMGALPPAGDMRWQIGLAGYLQRQATARSGPGITQDVAAERYAVNSLGAAASVAWPSHRTSLAVKVFKEIANRSTFQGYSVQVSGAIAF